MATSTYQTAENVKFDGTTTNAVVLKNNAGVKSLVVVGKHSDIDVAALDALVASYGGVTPLAAAIAGKQTVNFGGSVVGANATGLQNVAAATAATATINVGGAVTGASSTGLSNNTGTSGSISALFNRVAAAADASGLANDTTVYSATITVDGVAKPVSAAGSTMQTLTTVLSTINTALGASGTAAIANGEIKITSASKGTTSKVTVADTNLFSTLAGFAKFLPTASGGGAARKYSASVFVDGVLKPVTITGSAAQTYTTLVAAINTALGSAATAAITGGNIVITSATTGTSSSVKVFDTGLFSNLTGFAGISTVGGTGSQSYKATITVDGVDVAVSVQGSSVQTFTLLVTALNTALSTRGTAAITGGNIVVTSSTTGSASTVSITDGGLFKALTGFVKVNPAQNGAADMVEILQRERTANGAKYSDVFKIETVGAKPAVQPNTPRTTKFIYFNGTVWKYLADDSSV